MGSVRKLTSADDGGRLRRWASDTGIVAAGDVAARLLSLAAFAALSGSLSDDAFGLVGAVFSLGAAAGLLAESGIGTWVMREASEMPDRAREMAPVSLVIFVLTGALLLPGVVLYLRGAGAAVPASYHMPLALLALYPISNAVALMGEASFRASRRLGPIVLLSVVEKVALLTLTLAFAANALGIAAFAAGYFATGASRLATLVVLNRRAGPQLPLPRLADVRAAVRSARPFFGARLFTNVVPRLDAAIIAAVRPEIAAYFFIADRIIGIAQLLPNAASLSLYPHARYLAARRSAVIGAFGVGLIGSIGLSLLIQIPSIARLTGTDSDAISWVVAGMSIVLPFTFASSVVITLRYVGGEEERVFRRIAAVSVVSTIGLVGLTIALGLGGSVVAYVSRQAGLFAALWRGELPAPRPCETVARIEQS